MIDNEIILVNETVAEKVVRNGKYTIERSFIIISNGAPEDYYTVCFYGEYFNYIYSYAVMFGRWNECFGYLQSIEDVIAVETTTEEEFNSNCICTLVDNITFQYNLT